METGRQHKLTTVNLRLSLLFSLLSENFEKVCKHLNCFQARSDNKISTTEDKLQNFKVSEGSCCHRFFYADCVQQSWSRPVGQHLRPYELFDWILCTQPQPFIKRAVKARTP